MAERYRVKHDPSGYVHDPHFAVEDTHRPYEDGRHPSYPYHELCRTHERHEAEMIVRALNEMIAREGQNAAEPLD